MRVLVLHNDSAGDEDVAAEALTWAFAEADHDVAYRPSKGDGIDPKEAARADCVVAAGGDGTVGRVLRRLGPAGAPLAIVPLGSSNNLARALGIAGDAARIARGLADAEERRLDVGLAVGPWGERLFVEGVGLGPIARVIEVGKAKKLRAEGKRSFGPKALPDFLAKSEPQRWQVVADGTPLPGEMLLLEILNIPVAGAGMRLAPDARIDDRRLDVTFLPPERRRDFHDWVEAGAEGAAPVEVLQARAVSLQWAGGALRLDDKFPDEPAQAAQVEVRLHPVQARVLVPRGGR